MQARSHPSSHKTHITYGPYVNYGYYLTYDPYQGERVRHRLPATNCQTTNRLLDYLYLQVIPEWFRELNTTIGLLVRFD
jgi:hypothetical protein